MAIANVTLNTKTYGFSSDQNGLVTMLETSGGIPTGFSPFSFRLDAPKSGGQVYRASWNLALPVVATVDSDCTCVGQELRRYAFRSEALIPVTSTTAERTDFGLRIKDVFALAMVQTMMSGLVRPN